eukprot:363692-Chlamydomonas_euryale.AAC.6
MMPCSTDTKDIYQSMTTGPGLEGGRKEVPGQTRRAFSFLHFFLWVSLPDHIPACQAPAGTLPTPYATMRRCVGRETVQPPYVAALLPRMRRALFVAASYAAWLLTSRRLRRFGRRQGLAGGRPRASSRRPTIPSQRSPLLRPLRAARLRPT